MFFPGHKKTKLIAVFVKYLSIDKKLLKYFLDRMSFVDGNFNSARRSQASIQIIRTGPSGHIIGFMDGYLTKEHLDQDFDVGLFVIVSNTFSK